MVAKLLQIIILTVIGRCIWAQKRRDSESTFYSNSWVIVTPKDNKYVDLLAERHGFINRGQIGAFEGHFLLEHKKLKGRMRRSLVTHTQRLTRDPHVTFAVQQKILKRSKRGFLDPLFKDQWHLNNTGQTPGPVGFDINVGPVWRSNYTGRGILVSILDDGIEHTHPDLRENYDARASYDYNSNDRDPLPRYTPDNINRHGTRCAGQVAAVANNNICGVGVAYNARIGGVRMLDGFVTDVVEAQSLSHGRDFVDIYSISWGPEDDGSTFDGPGLLTKRTLKQGVKKGRSSLGSIFVFASGNGGQKGDHCSCDGYVTSPFTISIGAVDNHGRSPWYAEKCPAILAVTYSSGDSRDKQIVTTDLNSTCTHHHTGSSAASPIAAGIFALVLEANPSLSWRDLQYLVVNTSKKTDPSDADWQTNGAGFHVNHKYGFGVLDTAALVGLAASKTWRKSKKQMMCKESQRLLPSKMIPKYGNVVLNINSTGCQGRSKCVTKLEHVKVYVRLFHRRRGSLRITLTSPMGTRSELLAPRIRDLSTSVLHWWFMTVFSWGESPVGTWNLNVSDTMGYSGVIKRWSLRFYGICDRTRGSKRREQNGLKKVKRQEGEKRQNTS